MKGFSLWVLILPALVVLGGCASADEWNTWYSHSSHFASGEHMGFSVRNDMKAPAKVTRRDVALAGDQAWWGKAVTVEAGQILER